MVVDEKKEVKINKYDTLTVKATLDDSLVKVVLVRTLLSFAARY